MRTLKALLVTALAASTLTLTPSAEAVTSVDVQANDVTVKGNNCKSTDIVVSGDWASEVHNEIDLKLYDPNGIWYDTASFSDDSDGVVEWSRLLCGDYDPTGSYDVEVTATGYDADFIETSAASGATSFRFSQAPKTASKLTAERARINRGGYKWLVTGELTRAGKKFRNQLVCLEGKSEGVWLQIECLATNRRGVAAWKFKPNTFAWRLKYDGNITTEADTSTTFRTPRVGNAKLAVTAAVNPEDVIRR